MKCFFRCCYSSYIWRGGSPWNRRHQPASVAYGAGHWSSATPVCSTEDTHIPRGASVYPVIRTRLDLKGTKKTHILISAALNTFTLQRKKNIEMFQFELHTLNSIIKKKSTFSSKFGNTLFLHFHNQMVSFLWAIFFGIQWKWQGHRKTKCTIAYLA